MFPASAPTRKESHAVTTSAYILHAGWDKWRGGDEQARLVHGMAAGAFPFLHTIPPAAFLKALAATEIATGTMLLAPVVSNRLAGAALTTFAGSLMTMYLRTSTLHKLGSVWPTSAGTAVSKDIWMLGIGLSLLADTAGPVRRV